MHPRLPTRPLSAAHSPASFASEPQGNASRERTPVGTVALADAAARAGGAAAPDGVRPAVEEGLGDRVAEILSRHIYFKVSRDLVGQRRRDPVKGIRDRRHIGNL